MKLLLDTECWLWAQLDPDRLGETARDLVTELRNPVYLSAASSWEIAIKAGLGKLKLPQPPERWVPRRMADMGVLALPIQHVHALGVSTLPPHHADPFDRLLVIQAQIERCTLVTADAALLAYDVETIWAGTEPPPRPKARRRGRATSRRGR